MKRALVVLAAVAAISVVLFAASASEKASKLRNRGFAELENEQPAKAEETFALLAKATPDDPLPWANLAIARLRQQKTEPALEAIGKGLEQFPDDYRLIAIRGEIESWSGRTDAALESFRRAASLAPEDIEAQYTLYRTATTTGGEGADEAAGEALDRLARLRPENLLVLLQLGRSARESGDRAAASSAYLRIRDLIWQAPAGADKILDGILDSLEAGELDAIRVPSLRLENLLKVTPMYRESLRELQTGIQGLPIAAFGREPQATDFGSPAKTRFRGRRIAKGAGRALAVADLTGDERPELIRLAGDGRLWVLPAAGGEGVLAGSAGKAERLLIADLDNDGGQDVLAYGDEASSLWRNQGPSDGGRLGDESEAFGLAGLRGAATAVVDFDIEGDLDLAVFSGSASRAELYRNALDGPLQAVGSRTLPAVATGGARDALATDLDRDGDVDLLALGASSLVRLDNLRQGRFAARSAGASLAGFQRIASADFDADGFPDLVAVGKGVRFLRNEGGRLATWSLGQSLKTSARFSAVVPFDADNDGRLDVAVGGQGGLAVFAIRGGKLTFVPVEGGPGTVTALAAADLDGDGDLDLVADGPDGLYRFDNEGGNANHWLSVRLKGLDKGNSKNNLFGLGSTLEVRSGRAYQFREVTGDTTHFGLGQIRTPDLVRVVWTNGVPQNRFDPTTNQRIVEEQILKGSCPFLYAWDGERFRFVTDLLWGAPIGLPVAAGAWAGADPEELVRVDGLEPRDGRYELRITEELWEAAFFDYARLWVVDHPAEVEVASSLKILPGRSLPETVFASRGLRPVARAVDARGRDVTERVRARDEVYADGWERSRYQGLARDAWSFRIDLGEAPARPIRLHLDGWIFPADASLNLALDQRGEGPVAPGLEMKTARGWEPLLADMGFPAGKTKTMVVDTPALPQNVRELRIVSNQWLSWDRIAWTAEPSDAEALVVAKLAPDSADLRSRGFSRLVRKAPNAPHEYDYQRVSARSPWLPFPGTYTRFGDVGELLSASDSRSVVLAAGDELALSFDAATLPPPARGWTRTLFLESHGWDKDADRNTYQAAQVEPLPFRGMSGYPYGEAESFPDSPEHADYLDRYQTRRVPAER